LTYDIFFISESAATIDFGSTISEEMNKKIIALFDRLNDHPAEGLIEAIPAYSSITLYFDICSLRSKINPQMKIHDWIIDELHKQMQTDITVSNQEKHVVRIPVCYDASFAPDLPWIAKQRKIDAGEIVRLHHSTQYRVYMLGFLPGFAYMAEVDERISIPRKPQPRPIVAGGVGIAGRQTGIYPLKSPGGWQIVGRTPVKMFDINANPMCRVKAGDYVEFYPITKDEFENY